jgi:hypothetical protein
MRQRVALQIGGTSDDQKQRHNLDQEVVGAHRRGSAMLVIFGRRHRSSAKFLAPATEGSSCGGRSAQADDPQP